MHRNVSDGGDLLMRRADGQCKETAPVGGDERANESQGAARVNADQRGARTETESAL